MSFNFSLRSLAPRQSSLSTFIRSFSTSPATQARTAPGGPPDRNAPVRRSRQPAPSEASQRIKVLKRNMFSPAPPPLRMARLRHLRHWTIHRAWQLFRRQQRTEIAEERRRIHAGMYKACEELRATAWPGKSDVGYLYRVAMEKKGIYGVGDVPIEYAKMQTEYPPTEAWNHDWKR
ncbi:hypothetical protein S40293_05992 [Stachybotrys chartarum IBT 40293]|nr:hypothetical protein S40293_05992 [Stachybotrys chartarum IBT 40293]KFA73987.1 hypothetical protein S40288_07101 [Stachybotrys chartarum IBT 40288]